MSAVFAFTFLFLLGFSQSVTLYLTNNSREVAPKITDYVLKFDTDSSTLDAYRTSIPPGDEIVSGAIICGDIYYAAWVDVPVATGLFSFNITSNTLLSYFEMNNNYHTMTCTSTPNVVLVVSNNFGSPPVYELDEITFKNDNSKDPYTKKVVGTFSGKEVYPSDFDSIFSFNADSSELWAAWSDKNENSGTLDIMDTATGKIKNSYDYPRSGQPYFTLPTTLNGDTFKGAMIDQNSGEIDFVSITKDDRSNSLSVTKEIKSAQYLNCDGAPMAVCNGTGYLVFEYINVNSFDINSGKKIKTYDLQEKSQN
eukprot:135717_1